ncbi:MAG: hypothetical protein HONDAALG_03484 [Gammaproteobacteria bacterium]|nr:hypothetical protein [Gammaproteobacteria bacterium]
MTAAPTAVAARSARRAKITPAQFLWTPLEKPELAFGYRYKRSGHPHNHIVHDWEVQEAHRQYKRRYAGKALEHQTRMYGETIPTRNLHFIMGTMAAHPRTFIVIGLLRSGLDPAELAKQSDLLQVAARRDVQSK